MESFIGSVWFASFTFVAGYLVGHVIAIDKVKSMFFGAAKKAVKK